MKNALLGFLFLFLFQWTEDARASHAMGAEINYTCLGNNQYQITMNFYRDCVGIVAPTQMIIHITSSCFPDNSMYLLPTPGSPTQISTVCPTAVTTCNGGTFTGIEAWEYRGVITLPGECADWNFSHSEASRNASITTITGAGTDNQYVYTLMNNTNGICNNSPFFGNPPVPFACLGQQFCYTNAAYDVDGDSLSYQLITPLTGPGAGDTITYLSPYTYTQPLVSNPPLSFSPSLGMLCMAPQQMDVTVFAILVNEYRNGILIGQTERDVQLTILTCGNSTPTVTGIDGTPGTNRISCPNFPVDFSIYTMDNDAADRTFLTWDNAIPAASFSIFNTHRDSAHFHWTPSLSDVSATPYCFSVNVTDDHCPYIGTTSKNFCITVLPPSDAFVCNWEHNL
ncbi:MAG: hypothetical protein IPG90_21695 [Bacteroidetes bacterium]|nr:hypothetical protein [Bacteroidota bacterium]